MNLAKSFGTSSLFKTQLYFYILAISNWKLKNVNDIIYHIKRNQIPRNKSNKMSTTSWYEKLHNVIEKNLRDNSLHSINYQKVLKSVCAACWQGCGEQFVNV